MRQKIRDFGLLIRKDRKTQTLAGLVIVLLFSTVVTLNMDSGRPRRSAQSKPQVMNKVETGVMGASESYRDIEQAFNGEIKEIQKSLRDIQSGMKNREESFTAYEDQTANIFKRIIDRINELESMPAQAPVVETPNYPRAATVIDDQGNVVQTTPLPEGATDVAYADYGESESLEPFGTVEDEEPVAAPLPQRQRVAFIAPGDSVRVKILAGVNAPTDGTPYPVVMQISGDIVGPGGSSLPLGDARVIAAAQGSLSDSRALFRLSELSLALPDGQRRVYKIDGWVVGEDGIRGMPGILIDHLGRQVSAQTILGTLQGLSLIHI